MTATKPRMKEKQRQYREDVILDVARELLSSKGFAAMTLDDVIAEVGISKTTLYQHFVSKEELVLSVLRREVRRAREHLLSLAEALPPRAALEAMIGWTVDRRFGPHEPCRFDVTGVLAAGANETLRADERELIAVLEPLFARLPSVVPPLFAAQAFLSLVKDWSYEGLLGADRLDLPTLKAGMIRLLLN